LTLREGLAPIDLLSRAAIAFGGGRPRHQFDAAANISSRGMGLRLAATFRSASRLAASALPGEAPSSLRFGSLSLFDLRAFADAGRLLGQGPLARGTRLSLAINNLFNAREEVTDRAGLTPLAYQPAFRDALGRTVEFEIRRRF
jgi:outer membrane receptor protein involved in Fe transport